MNFYMTFTKGKFPEIIFLKKHGGAYSKEFKRACKMTKMIK